MNRWEFHVYHTGFGWEACGWPLDVPDFLVFSIGTTPVSAMIAAETAARKLNTKLESSGCARTVQEQS